MSILSYLFEKNYEDINSKKVKQMLKEKEKYQFVDVRTKQEYDDGHIKGFDKNLDFYQFSHNLRMLDKLDKDKPVVVACQTGSRSKTTCQLMHKIGFKELYNVYGGMMLYRGPVEK